MYVNKTSHVGVYTPEWAICLVSKLTPCGMNVTSDTEKKQGKRPAHEDMCQHKQRAVSLCKRN